jgi:hypothetical protein
MKCDGCGRQFPASKAESATRNEPVGPGGRHPSTKLVALSLCPACAQSRRNTLWFVVGAVLTIFNVGAILALCL